MDAIVSNYLGWAGSLARDVGLPANKVMGHAGANFPELPVSENKVHYNSSFGGLNNATLPGWSFYKHAHNPALAANLSAALDELPGTLWGASWYYKGGNEGTAREQWYILSSAFLSYAIQICFCLKGAGAV